MRWLLLLGLVGCTPQRAACELPEATTYSCEPTREVVGCVGGPEWTSGPDRADVGKAFPIGCDVNVPECSSVSAGVPRVFECAIGPDGKPDWFEPI